MKRLLLAIVSAAVLLCPDFGHAQGYWPGSAGVSAKHSQHATDCTALTNGVKGEICQELDADTFYVCELATCSIPGDWTAYTGAGGAGDITDVGDCPTGACFEGVGAETTLRSATSILLDLDNDFNGTESLIIRDGLDATIFTVTEGSAVAITGAGSNFNVSGTAPYIGITDTDGTNDPADTGVLRLGNTDTICWEISPAGTDACVSVSSASVLTPTGIAAVKVPSSLVPIVAGVAQIAFDTNILGTKGAAVVHNGTEATYVVAATDVPVDGEVPRFVDATDTIEWQATGTGTVTDVGDCNGPACFTGAEGTTLDSNTDFILDLDDDNNGTEGFQIRDGLDAVVFEVTEAGIAEALLGFQGPDADPADDGVVRLGNTESICWESNPPSVNEGCFVSDASENLTYSGSQFSANIVSVARNAQPAALQFDVFGGATASYIDIDPILRGTGRTLGVRINSATTLLTIAEDTSSFTFESTSVVDAGGAVSFEVPNSAAPTTNATGEIALDTTITDHQPLHQYFDGGENMSIIAIDTAQLPALDNEIIKYDAGTDKFVLEADAGAGCVELQAAEIDCPTGGGGCLGELLEETGLTFTTANFYTTADRQGSWNFNIPDSFTGTTTASVRIDWFDDAAACTNEATDDVCLTFETLDVTDAGDLLAPTFGTASGTNDTCATQGAMQSVTKTAFTHGFTVGHRGVLTLHRDVAGTPTGCASEDDYTGDVKILAVTICPE